MNGRLPRLRIKTKMNKVPAKRPNILLLLIILGIFFLIRYMSVYFPVKELKYGEFYRLLKENPQDNKQQQYVRALCRNLIHFHFCSKLWQFSVHCIVSFL